MTDIAFIAPSRQLAALISDIVGNDEDVQVVTARLEDGVAKAKEAIEQGARLLVSRGFTYQMIVDAFPHIPVLEVEFSGYDILRALRKAQALGKRIAVVDSQDVINGCMGMEEILGVTTKSIPFPIRHYREYASGIDAVVEAGADCIVGNLAVVHAARGRGLQGVVIESGVEAAARTIAAARQVLTVERIRAVHARQIDTIINSVDYGILAIDGEGRVTASNTEAERLIRMAEEDCHSVRDRIISRMRQCLGSGDTIIGTVEKCIGGSEAVVSYHPIIITGEIVGAVATMQELKRLRAVEQRAREELADKGRIARHSFMDIVSQSPEMRKIIEGAKRFAGFDATVLILGETGVGKEYFAHAIHQASSRKDGPFVTLNCAAIPENILESELFGYVEGAFTGAKKGGKMGLFEQAHGGTIFLDEIGEMSEHLQARLLRVLQEHEVYRVGDDRVIPVDIRVIAATNQDLWQMVSKRKFREDLYYRLDVLTVRIPPLRERKADIEIFVRTFIREFNTKYRTAVQGIDSAGMELLRQYDWPGNIRELQNMISRLIALTSAPVITTAEVRYSISNLKIQRIPPGQGLKELEEAAIREALAKVGGSKQQAAELLGIGRATLWRKLKQLNISPE